MGETQPKSRGASDWHPDSAPEEKPAAETRLELEKPPIISRLEAMSKKAQEAAVRMAFASDTEFAATLKRFAGNPETIAFLRDLRGSGDAIKEWLRESREQMLMEGLQAAVESGLIDKEENDIAPETETEDTEAAKLERLGFMEAAGPENFFYTELNAPYTWLSGNTAARDKFSGIVTSYPNEEQAEQLLQDSVMRLKPGHSVGAYLKGRGRFILFTRTESGYNKGVKINDPIDRPKYVNKDGSIAEIKTFAVALTPEQRQKQAAIRAA